MKCILLLVLALLASPAWAGDRNLSNPDLNGNLHLKVNQAGTVTDAVTITGSTLGVTFPGQITPTGGIKGVTNGSTPCSGCVGQVITNAFSATAPSATNSPYQVGSPYLLPAGTWLVMGECGLGSEVTYNGGTYLSCALNTTASLTNQTIMPTATGAGGAAETVYPIVVYSTGTTSIYAMAEVNYTGSTTITVSASMTAVRLY